jgi:hypothetical protein
VVVWVVVVVAVVVAVVVLGCAPVAFVSHGPLPLVAWYLLAQLVRMALWGHGVLWWVVRRLPGSLKLNAGFVVAVTV